MPVNHERITLRHLVTSAPGIKTGGLCEGGFLPSVHIGRCADHIAQAWYPKSAALALITGDCLCAGVAHHIGRISDSDDRQLLVGEEWWGMALGAACDKRSKHIETRFFFFGECRMVAMGVEIVAAIERNQ